MALINPSSLGNATYYYPVTVQGVFPVSSGTSTVYLLGNEDAGSWRATDLQLTLIYVRTAYGTVASPAAFSPGASGQGLASTGVSAAAVEMERAEARAFAAARLEREMAEMRARLEAVESRIEATRRAGHAAPPGYAGGFQP
jgi:hypothetical protein